MFKIVQIKNYYYYLLFNWFIYLFNIIVQLICYYLSILAVDFCCIRRRRRELSLIVEWKIENNRRHLTVEVKIGDAGRDCTRIPDEEKLYLNWMTYPARASWRCSEGRSDEANWRSFPAPVRRRRWPLRCSSWVCPIAASGRPIWRQINWINQL